MTIFIQLFLKAGILLKLKYGGRL